MELVNSSVNQEKQVKVAKKKAITTRRYKIFVTMLLTFTMICNCVSVSAASIVKPTASNGAVHKNGSVTYYNPDNQSWKSMSGSVLYSYKGKKDTKYYKPMFYIGAWVDNTGQPVTVEITSGYSKSVVKAVSATLGVSTTKGMVEKATSVSSSYSETVETASKMTQTFKLSLYSKSYQYRPALFGDLLKYTTVKTNRITKKASSGEDAYTFIDANDLDLRMAYK